MLLHFVTLCYTSTLNFTLSWPSFGWSKRFCPKTSHQMRLPSWRKGTLGQRHPGPTWSSDCWGTTWESKHTHWMLANEVLCLSTYHFHIFNGQTKDRLGRKREQKREDSEILAQELFQHPMSAWNQRVTSSAMSLHIRVRERLSFWSNKCRKNSAMPILHTIIVRNIIFYTYIQYTNCIRHMTFSSQSFVNMYAAPSFCKCNVDHQSNNCKIWSPQLAFQSLDEHGNSALHWCKSTVRHKYLVKILMFVFHVANTNQIKHIQI